MASTQCCSNRPVLDPNGGAGHVEKFGGLNTYISGSPISKLAIVLLSDVFGYEAQNLRKLADKTAAAGYFAVVPDFFHGDPYVPENADRPLPVWLKDHGTDMGFEEAKLVIEALKSKSFSAIGASGFSWGGKVVVELATSDHFIKAGVLLHPALVTVEDSNEVKVPISILGAEVDHLCPPELVKQFGKVLAAKSVDFHGKVFPKVERGWTTRYSVEDEEAVKKAEEAHQDMLDWFSKYVK